MDSAQSSEGQATGIDTSTTALPQVTATPDSTPSQGGLLSRAKGFLGGGQPSRAEPTTPSLVTPDAATPTPTIATNWPASEGGVTPGIAPNYPTGSATGEAVTSGIIVAPTPGPELPPDPWAKPDTALPAPVVAPSLGDLPVPTFPAPEASPATPQLKDMPEPFTTPAEPTSTAEPALDTTPAVAPVWSQEPEAVVETTAPAEPEPVLTSTENPSPRLSEADVAEFRRILSLMDPRVLGPDIAQPMTENADSTKLPEINNSNAPIDQAVNTITPSFDPSTPPSSSLV